MFRKKPKDDNPTDSVTLAASGGGIPEGVLTDETHDELVSELTKTGKRGQATITSVQWGGQHDPEGGLWRMGVRINPSGGEPFDSEIALLSIGYDEEFQPWNIGDTTTVAYDPDDTSRVAFLPPNMQQVVRWQVPDVCPECGARVDQAIESLSDSPTCHFCHQPLPTQPAF